MPHYIDESRVANFGTHPAVEQKLEHRLESAYQRALAGATTVWVAKGLDQPLAAEQKVAGPLTETQDQVYQQMKSWLQSPRKTRAFHFKH